MPTADWRLKGLKVFSLIFRCTWWTLRTYQSHAAPPPSSTPSQCSTSTTTPTSYWRNIRTWWYGPAAATDTGIEGWWCSIGKLGWQRAATARVTLGWPRLDASFLPTSSACNVHPERSLPRSIPIILDSSKHPSHNMNFCFHQTKRGPSQKWHHTGASSIGNFTLLQCWATKLSPSLLAVESSLHGSATEWMTVCVCGKEGVFKFVYYVFMEVRVWEATAPSPLAERGEGKTELLWDQSKRCFPSLLLSHKNTRWIGSQKRLEQLLMNNFSTAHDPAEFDAVLSANSSQWHHLVIWQKMCINGLSEMGNTNLVSFAVQMLTQTNTEWYIGVSRFIFPSSFLMYFLLKPYLPS